MTANLRRSVGHSQNIFFAEGIIDEPGLPSLAPALVNAIHAATGKRLRAPPCPEP